MYSPLDDTRREMDEIVGTVVYANTCPRCGKFSRTEIEVMRWAEGLLRDGKTRCLCDDCRQKEEHLAENQRVYERLQQAAVPGEFLTWNENKGNNRLLAIVRRNRTKSIFIAGANGCGKTRAAAIALADVLHEGGRVRFYRFVDLAGEYARLCRSAYGDGGAFIAGVLRDNDVLLLDDIGKRRITENAGEMLYDLFDRIYSGMADTKVWITSNLNLAALAGQFVNPDMGDAVVSRLDRMGDDGKMIFIEGGIKP